MAIYQGYKSGAVKVVLGLVIMIIVIPIVYFTYKPITDLVIENTNIHEGIKQGVYETLESKDIERTEKIDDGEFLPVFTNKINELIHKAKEENYNNIVEKVSDDIARFAVQSIVIIGWSMVLYIILSLIKLIIVKTVDVLPVINTLNYVSGSVLQALKVLIITFLILYLLQFILPVIKSDFILENIEKTNIIKYMYNNNLINVFIK